MTRLTNFSVLLCTFNCEYSIGIICKTNKLIIYDGVHSTRNSHDEWAINRVAGEHRGRGE